MSQSQREYDGRPEGGPIRPGLALKVIFERNMGLSMERVSEIADIDISILKQIADEGRRIDRETGKKLKYSFGDTGRTLIRMQFVYDFFKEKGYLPPLELVYTI